MQETNQIDQKDEFFVNFNTKHGLDGFSPFRKKWTIIVFLEFRKNEIITFQNVQQKFSMSPSVLSSTLKELTTEKLISRKAFGEIPPMRVEYKITSHGEKLISILSDLINLISQSKLQK